MIIFYLTLRFIAIVPDLLKVYICSGIVSGCMTFGLLAYRMSDPMISIKTLSLFGVSNLNFVNVCIANVT